MNFLRSRAARVAAILFLSTSVSALQNPSPDVHAGWFKACADGGGGSVFVNLKITAQGFSYETFNSSQVKVDSGTVTQPSYGANADVYPFSSGQSGGIGTIQDNHSPNRQDRWFNNTTGQKGDWKPLLGDPFENPEEL